MQKGFTVVAMAAFLVAFSFAAPNNAAAKSDKAMKANKAQVQDCLKVADPKMKDECVSKAAKGKATKADKAGKKAMGKAKGLKK